MYIYINIYKNANLNYQYREALISIKELSLQTMLVHLVKDSKLNTLFSRFRSTLLNGCFELQVALSSN